VNYLYSGSVKTRLYVGESGDFPGAQRRLHERGPLDPVEPRALAREEGVGHKPGSVVGNHSSGIHVTVDLKRPTRKRARISAALPRRFLSLR
jgi:hypothetical protein